MNNNEGDRADNQDGLILAPVRLSLPISARYYNSEFDLIIKAQPAQRYTESVRAPQ
jgi:hypothetical protein